MRVRITNRGFYSSSRKRKITSGGGNCAAAVPDCQIWKRARNRSRLPQYASETAKNAFIRRTSENKIGGLMHSKRVVWVCNKWHRMLWLCVMVVQLRRSFVMQATAARSVAPICSNQTYSSWLPWLLTAQCGQISPKQTDQNAVCSMHVDKRLRVQLQLPSGHWTGKEQWLREQKKLFCICILM